MDADLRPQLAQRVELAMTQAGREIMQWGRDDCALWCADVLGDVLGYDPAGTWRGRYRTREGAGRVLGTRGLLGAVRAMARRYGWRRIAPASAQAGDVGLAWVPSAGEGAPILATVICRAPGWFVGRNDRGFTGVRAADVAGAWSVLDDALPGAAEGVKRIAAPTIAAVHEPVSAAIGLTALIASIGVSTAVAGAVGGAIVTFAITSALSVGVSMLASSLRPQAGTGPLDTGSDISNLPEISQTSAVQVTERQSIPFKRVIVGSAYVGGALFFEGVIPPHLTMGVLINYGKITGVDKVFIGTNRLDLGVIQENTILTPIAVPNQPNYPARLKLCFRFGDDNQGVDPLIAQDYLGIDGEYRQRGIATAVYRYDFGADKTEFTDLWGQVSRPNAYVVVRGVPVYDPRDPAQDLDDESTWEWSNNATLVQAWYLTRSWGGRIPKDRILWDRIATSADYDDSLIGCADGTLIKRHTIDGVITLAQKPFEVMQQLLTANRGSVLESAGNIWIDSSAPKTPVATIYDGILTSGIKYQGAKAKRDLVNKLQVRFVATSQDYQMVDGPLLNRTDLQTIDNEVLTSTLSLSYTQDHRRAQRLQKAYLESARLGRNIQLSVDATLLAVASDELIGSVVTVNSVLFSAANGNYLVTSVGFSDDFTSLSLALTEYDPTIETDWNSATDEQPFEVVELNTINRAPVAVNDSYSTPFNTTLNVAAPGVLTNDSDPDSNPITAVLVSTTSRGVLTLNADGSFQYIPGATSHGLDTFTYRASDGSLTSNLATVTITIVG